MTLTMYQPAEEAMAHVDQALLERPDIVWAHHMLASCASMVGDKEKAANSVAIIEQYAPGIGAQDIVNAIPHQSQELRERFWGALVKAGFRP